MTDSNAKAGHARQLADRLAHYAIILSGGKLGSWHLGQAGLQVVG